MEVIQKIVVLKPHNPVEITKATNNAVGEKTAKRHGGKRLSKEKKHFTIGVVVCALALIILFIVLGVRPVAPAIPNPNCVLSNLKPI